MFTSGKYCRPRRCLFYIIGFFICQLILVFQFIRFERYTDTPASITLHHANGSGNRFLDWREFISHTPLRSEDYYQYNLHLSDTLGVIRNLPSTRHYGCMTRPFKLPPPLASTVSVVISFHNEARSMLLRTIVSLLRRTPEEYLHELILVDDGSQDVTLLDDLKRWMDGVFEARRDRLGLIFRRNQKRMGLISSRNRGASLASGHYVLFLDSHCEVNEEWLEPLLERLALNPHLAVSPLLDPIDPTTLSYRKGNEMLKGGFDWSLHFHWLKRQLAIKELPEMPYKSPAFAGGVLMMSRDWFLKLGSFNSYLKIWGGESIELAIKLWLCGGQIEIVPCSRIGHIFRRRHAFDFPPQSDQDQQLSPAQETYLQLHFDELSATGTLRNEDRCLHARQMDSQLILASCYLSDITQWSMLRSSGQLSTQRELCLGVGLRMRIALQPCGRNETMRKSQRWLRLGTHLLHVETHLCLDNPFKDRLEMSTCRSHAVSQSFQFALEMEGQT
ncbi:putative polypeptide N-acetylgalactosaminyltransferase 13 isoform X3 [Drosophila subpulchrella]|uniref:putative polypeptide N-acetylgalactosaminyltransferase 13 isoform X3 n=1 Tax=Drosophila subpulchrella TaxID=1486046 RepID=UPI0018A145AC|nr:putative polypeptide N-acetylgalactosaminyltransferase 13 isoform X3 [Drosophila subpulchrella]